jgi:hypothetical protein
LPALPLSAYTGEYTNQIYGTATITQRSEQLLIKFNSHPDLYATLDYLDKDEWLLRYNNIEYGIFAVKFNVSGNKVSGVIIPANDFVELDPYLFEKK